MRYEPKSFPRLRELRRSDWKYFWFLGLASLAANLVLFGYPFESGVTRILGMGLAFGAVYIPGALISNWIWPEIGERLFRRARAESDR